MNSLVPPPGQAVELVANVPELIELNLKKVLSIEARQLPAEVPEEVGKTPSKNGFEADGRVSLLLQPENCTGKVLCRVSKQNLD